MNKIHDTPRIAIGPVLYFWSREKLLQFYADIASSPADIVYLGEVVCSKRRALRREDWLEIGAMLQAAGKEVVYSTLTLIEAQSELHGVERWCAEGGALIEANDMAAVQFCQQQHKAFVSGPHINLYNAHTLAELQDCGLQRMVWPLELSAASLRAFLDQARALELPKPELEVFVWGRLPLAHSARCFTARHHQLAKDDCGFICQQYPDGLQLATQEQQALFTLNGIQTQSAKTTNLLGDYAELCALGVDILRISPQAEGTLAVIAHLHALRGASTNTKPDTNTSETNPPLPALPAHTPCRGYWSGEAGMN